MQGARQSQVRKLDPTCCNEKILHAEAMACTAPPKTGGGKILGELGGVREIKKGSIFFFFGCIEKLLNLSILNLSIPTRD